MMPRIFTSLRTRLLLLVLIATLPALGLILYNGAEQRRLAAEAAQDGTLRLVRLVAGAQDAQIVAARQLLTSMAAIPNLNADHVGECNRTLSSLQEKVPTYTALSIINPQGQIVCNSVARPAENVSKEPYFQAALRTGQFTVGEYTLGPTTRKPVLPFLLPVVDPAGKVQAVLLGTLDLAWLAGLGPQIGLPPRSSLLVVAKGGLVLARYPGNEAYSGTPLPSASIVKAIAAKQGEGTAEVAGLDGIVRLFGFTLLPGSTTSGAYIAIGIPLDLAYADVNRITARNLLSMVAVMVMGLGAAWLFSDIFFLRQLRALLAGARQMEKGDLSTQVPSYPGAGELEDLAVSFNHMASALKRRSQELESYTVKLEHSNRELQEFAYIASHDLQEPLRKIQAFGERLNMKYSHSLGAEGQDYLDRMVKSASRLQHLIDDLLSYSRVSTRTRPFVRVDLTGCAREALADLEPRLEATHGEVKILPLPSIEADPDQMRMLFQNLIGNALKFHREGVQPQVTISANVDPGGKESQGDTVEVYVQDNGIGFDEKYLNRIFQPFQRLHARDVYEGSGIGLAICRKIVQRHNGAIGATSRAGEGSTFIITLPRHQSDDLPANTSIRDG